jgi:phosphate transport system permease protein
MAQTLEPGSVGQTTLSLNDLRSRPQKRRREWLMRQLFLSAAVFSFLISILIVLTVVREAWSFISQVDTSSLLAIGWFPRRGFYDIPTLLIGSLLVTAIAMVVAIPLGLAAAIYLSEYAKPRVRRVVKPILEILAGIPSVVLGYFAISFITPEVLTPFFEVGFFNLAAAGLAVGVLTLPIVASVSEDAMRAVPSALREASYGMGARKITTSLRVVFPAAISGIVAAIIIAISRAIGETMIVAIASGATGGSLRSWDVLQPGQTMTAAMAALGAGTDQVKGDDLAFQSLFFIGLLLFLITLGLNVIGNWFVRRLREKY